MDRIIKTGCVEGVVDLYVISHYRWCLISLAFDRTELKSCVHDKQEGFKHQTLVDTKNELDGIGPDG